MDSLNAHLERLKNRMTEFATLTIDSDWLKVFIDLLTQAVNLVNSLVKSIGGFSVIGGLIGGAFLQKAGYGIFDIGKNSKGGWGTIFGNMLKPSKPETQIVEKRLKPLTQETQNFLNKWSDKVDPDKPFIPQYIEQIGASMKGIKENKESYLGQYVNVIGEEDALKKTHGEIQKDMQKGSVQVREEVDKTGVAFGKLTSKLKGIASTALTSMAVSAAISLTAKGIELFWNNVIKAEENAIKKGEEAKKSITEIKDEFDKKSTFADESLEEYLKLREKTAVTKEGGLQNVSLSTEEYDKFLSLNKEIAELFPSLVETYDSNGNALLNLSTNADTATESIKGLIETERMMSEFEIGEQLPKVATAAAIQIKNATEEMEKYQSRTEALRGVQQLLGDYAEKDYSFDQLKIGDFGVSDNLQQFSMSYDTKDKIMLQYANSLYGIYEEAWKQAGIMVKDTSFDEEIFNRDTGETFTQRTLQFMMDTLPDEAQFNTFKEKYSDLLAEYAKSGLPEDLMESVIKANAADAEIKATWNGLVPSLISQMTLYDDYRKLGDNKIGAQLQQIISDDISNMDYMALSEKDKTSFKTETRQFLRERFLDPIIAAAKDTKTGELKEDVLKDIMDTISDVDVSRADWQANIIALSQRLFPDDEQAQIDFRIAIGATYVNKDDKELFTGSNKLSQLQDLTGINWKDIQKTLGTDEIEYALKLSAEGRFEFDGKTADELFEYVDKIREADNELRTLNPVGTLAELFKDEDYSSKVETWEKKLSSLSSAMNTIREGEILSSQTIADLQEEFSDINIDWGNISGSDISNMQVDIIEDWVSAIQEAKKEMTPAEAKKADAYMKNLVMSQGDLYDQESDLIQLYRKLNLTGNAAKNQIAQEAVDAEAQHKIGELKKSLEAEGEELDLNVVATLIATDQFSGTAEEIRAKYDDMKIKWDIELGTAEIQKDIDALTSSRDARSAKRQLNEALGISMTKDDYAEDNKTSMSLINDYEEQRQLEIEGVKRLNTSGGIYIETDDTKRQINAINDKYDKMVYEERTNIANNVKEMRELQLKPYENRIKEYDQQMQDTAKIRAAKEAKGETIFTEENLADIKALYGKNDNLQEEIDILENQKAQTEAFIQSLHGDVENNDEIIAIQEQIKEKEGQIADNNVDIANLRKESRSASLTRLQNEAQMLAHETTKSERVITNAKDLGLVPDEAAYDDYINDLENEQDKAIGIHEQMKRDQAKFKRDYIKAGGSLSDLEDNTEWQQMLTDLENQEISIDEFIKKIREARKEQAELPLTRLQNEEQLLQLETKNISDQISAMENAGDLVPSDMYKTGIATANREIGNLIDQRREILNDISSIERKYMDDHGHINKELLNQDADYITKMNDLYSNDESIKQLNDQITQWKKSKKELKELAYDKEQKLIQRELDEANRELSNPKKQAGVVDYINNMSKNAENIELIQKRLAEKQKEFNETTSDPEGYTEADQEYWDMIDGIDNLTSSLNSATDAQNEFVSSLVNLPANKFLKGIEEYEQELEDLQSEQELRTTAGYALTHEDYQARIQGNQGAIKKRGYLDTLYTIADAGAGLLGYSADSDLRQGIRENKRNNKGVINNLLTSIIGDKKADRELDVTNMTRDAEELSRRIEEAQHVFDDLELQGKEITEESYSDLMNKTATQIGNYEAIRDEWLRLRDTEGYDSNGNKIADVWTEYDQNYVAAQNTISELTQQQYEWNEAIQNIPLTNLQNQLSDIQQDATDIQDIMNVKNARGIKASVKDYKMLARNSESQVRNLEKQNKELIKQRSNLDRNSTKYRETNDQIKSNTSAMRQAQQEAIDYASQARRLITTQATDLNSAIQQALQESGSNTGLSNETIDSLMSGFSDLAGRDVSSMFYNTADGIKVDIMSLERLIQAEHELQMDGLENSIREKQNAISAYQRTIGEDNTNEHLKELNRELDDLMRQRSSAYAQYAEQMAQISRLAQIELANATKNQGAAFDSIMNYGKEAKEMYDKGLIGTDDFKTRAAAIDYWGFDDADTFIENWDKIKDYVTSEGEFNLNTFVNDLVDEGLGHWDDATGDFIADIENIEDAAKKFKGGIGQEWFESALGKVEEHGGFFAIIDSAQDAKLEMDKVNADIVQAEKKLAQMTLEGASKEDLDRQEEVIKAYKERANIVKEATDNYKQAAQEQDKESIENLIPTINSLEASAKEAIDRGDKQGARNLLDTAQQILEEHNLKATIDLETGNIEIDEQGLNELIQSSLTDAEKKIIILQNKSQQLQQEYDTQQHQYGNIDLNNRGAIVWNRQNLEENRVALQDWYDDASTDWESFVQDMVGTTSTVLGSSSEYDGVEIAFSPMLQTENGPELLTGDAVDDYINGLISDLGEGWTTEALLEADKVENGGKGLIADVGENAFTIGETMHDVEAIKNEAQFVQDTADIMSQIDTESMADQLNILKEAAPEAFDAIKFGDKDLATGFEEEERALDSLLGQLGLGQEKGDALVEALAQTGLIDYEPTINTDSVEDADDKVNKLHKDVEKPAEKVIKVKEEGGATTEKALSIQTGSATEQAEREAMSQYSQDNWTKFVTWKINAELDDGAITLDNLANMSDAELAKTFNVDVTNTEKLETIREIISEMQGQSNFDVVVKLEEGQMAEFRELLSPQEDIPINVNDSEAKAALESIDSLIDQIKEKASNIEIKFTNGGNGETGENITESTGVSHGETLGDVTQEEAVQEVIFDPNTDQMETVIDQYESRKIEIEAVLKFNSEESQPNVAPVSVFSFNNGGGNSSPAPTQGQAVENEIHNTTTNKEITDKKTNYSQSGSDSVIDAANDITDAITGIPTEWDINITESDNNAATRATEIADAVRSIPISWTNTTTIAITPSDAADKLKTIYDYITKLNDKTVTITTNRVINTTNTGGGPNKGPLVNGTAHAFGAAYALGNATDDDLKRFTNMATGIAKAKGDWGNKNPGRTLVGELGTEIVVFGIMPPYVVTHMKKSI